MSNGPIQGECQGVRARRHRRNRHSSPKDGRTSPMTVHPDSETQRRRSLAGQLPADRVVLVSSAAIALAFVAWGIVDHESLAKISSSALDWVIGSFGWIFILTSTGFVALTGFLAVSRFGRIRLGRDDERPEFR